LTKDDQQKFNADPARVGATLLVVEGDKAVPVSDTSTADLRTSPQLRMGRQVSVCIMNLHDWTYVQKKNPNTLRLSIGGHILSAAPSAIGPSEQEYVTFILHLDSTDSDDWKTWAAIVDAARHARDGTEALTVATADSKEFFGTSAYTKVLTTSDAWYWVAALFLVLIGALVYLAATSDFLRYTVGPAAMSNERSPFSLGLVQMAFWFCLSLAAYAYICLMTRQVHVPMGSVLGLLGISSTTGLAAVFVDKQKSASGSSLAAESAALSTRIRELTGSAVTPGSAAESELAQRRFRLAQVQALLEQTPADAPPPASQGFMKDILNDGSGISFHRFQIAVWTVVLGIVFVWAVYRNISMPEFDASLLTLMGISSGTYVGFKFSEKPKTGDTASGNAAEPVPAKAAT
jgi:hypothetical protein